MNSLLWLSCDGKYLRSGVNLPAGAITAIGPAINYVMSKLGPLASMCTFYVTHFIAWPMAVNSTQTSASRKQLITDNATLI